MNYSDLLASPQAQLLKLERVKRKSALARWFNSRPLHTAQQTIYEHPARFRVVACGRRFGKTELGRRASVEVAVHGGYVWWVSPTYPMAQDVWQQLSMETRDIRTDLNKSEREIRFEGGGRLRVLSGDTPDRLRGAGLDFLVIDEAAFCDEMVWQVLRPALADPGKQGRALFLSTPRGRNWFWRLYGDGIDPQKEDWASWRMPSYKNPFFLSSETESARRDMPERMFKQEIEAEFLDDYGAVFRNVAACIVPTPAPHTDVVIGVDWGKSNDYTVLTAIDRKTLRVLEIDRFNQISWGLQRGRLEQMARKYNPSLILAESNSIGEPNIEELMRMGLPVQGFQTTGSTKPALIDGLALAFEQQAIGIPDDPVLINELQAYEMERLPSGNWRYSAPDGGHDDMVISLALAYRAASTSHLQLWIF
jgi:phage terminase large subunit-like protein